MSDAAPSADPSRARGPDGRFPPGSGTPASGLPAAGAGWGGSANGRIAPSIAEGFQPTPEAISEGKARAKTLAELCRPRVESVALLWQSIVDDKNAHPLARLRASENIANRAEGMPQQRVENSGETVHRVISGEPLTPEQWAQKYTDSNAA